MKERSKDIPPPETLTSLKTPGSPSEIKAQDSSLARSRFSNALRPEILSLVSRFDRSLPGSDLVASLNDESRSALLLQRAANPYLNHRARVVSLSVEATALNCVLELSSQHIFKRLEATHKSILTRCSTNPQLFPSSEYEVAPFALRNGRINGDLFGGELTRSDLPCRVVEMRGSASRVPGVGSDAPYGFLLMHRDAPIAAVSYVVAEGPTLFVVMTQRLRQGLSETMSREEIKDHEKAARRLHLKDAVLELCSSVATELGCTSITYQGAHNNRWVHDMVPVGDDDGWSVTCEPRMRLQDAQETYDFFCEARGFTRDSATGNFRKLLSEPPAMAETYEDGRKL